MRWAITLPAILLLAACAAPRYVEKPVLCAPVPTVREVPVPERKPHIRLSGYVIYQIHDAEGYPAAKVIQYKYSDGEVEYRLKKWFRPGEEPVTTVATYSRSEFRHWPAYNKVGSYYQYIEPEQPDCYPLVYTLLLILASSLLILSLLLGTILCPKKQ